MFATISEVLEDLKEGKIICLADSESIENEIDMICLAKNATTEIINYMITNAKGLVCISMTAKLCDSLELQSMDPGKTIADKLDTPFCQSIDLNNGSTGVSAVERGKTARMIASNNASISDFVSPGHLFPLKAKKDLLKTRIGHTEASVTLAKLCGEQSAVICEIIKDDGTMLTVKDFEEWNKDKNLKLFHIDKLLVK